MAGGIYSEERCAFCLAEGKDGRMVDNKQAPERGGAVWCPDHPEVRAQKLIVRFGRRIFMRFQSYKEAYHTLNGLRFKVTEGSYDEREYKKANPLGFANLAAKYLEIKEQTVKPGTFTHVRREINKAAEFFGPTNIKEIQYGEIEDFLLSFKGISSKSRHNIKANLHAFFTWLIKRRVLRREQMPEFPEIPVKLGWRKTISHETQEAVLEEIKRLSWDKNPRIYAAAKWAATYIKARPGEILKIRECDIDRDQWIVYLPNHKTDRLTDEIKSFPLIPEDIELVKQLPIGFPNMPFFRRDRGGGGKYANTPFGKHLIYDYWKKACKNLEIEGVDLYGGTRHSTARNLRKIGQTPEQVKGLTGHKTTKAFLRYFQDDIEEQRAGYTLTRSDTPPIHRKGLSRIEKPK
jgi:integrase